MSDFTNAYNQVIDLVKDFKANEKIFLSSSYSEADIRNDFINKFFIALGWDVRHEQQKNPYEQEVRVEKPVLVAKAQKRADYTFYLSPNFRDVKFFVEAKKPFHDLEHKDYYFQTVRYGWNANTPVAVLTDFEEFVILDCRFRPDIKDILNFKIKSFHYSDYANEEKFREIYFLFSRESVSDGSVEKYAESLPKPKGKKLKATKGEAQAIDESFLEELDDIRTQLAKSFKKNNTHLTSEELTEATQRTIDRLVFIKFLEDKLIEPHHFVSEFGKKRSAWEDFITASITLDAKYNGVVFKKTQIDSHNIIEPDDKTFSKICEDLSHENTPYNFDAIPIHILGSIYERFLGKVVNATDKRVTIEEKPEVRKAGGVYYTPQYIVNYIVDNTIGKLIDGKTPKEISKLRFADIACGSGSFIITVYERLLDYHKRWYLDHPDQARKDGCILYEGAYRLSLQQKRDILTNNIYGVDLDSQAVEVTQLSLYLKLLEDETTATANDTWVMFKEKLLPDLSKNIVNGNSLIGTDILNSSLVLPFNNEPVPNLIREEETGGVGLDELKLKPMDFDKTFPEVMASGGFDAIVGNPPYVEFKQLSKEIKDLLETKYFSTNRKYDLFIPFIEKGILLLKKGGHISFIVPSMFTKRDYGVAIRKFIVENTVIDKLVYFGDFQVFKNVTVFPFIFIFSKQIEESTVETEIILFPTQKGLNHNIVNEALCNPISDDYSQKYKIDSNRFSDNSWEIASDQTSNLKNKILQHPKTKQLQELTEYIFVGIQSGKDEVFFVTKETINNYKLEKEIVIPILRGRDINSYSMNWSGTYIIYPYDKKTNEVISEKELKLNYPNTYSYLNANRRLLKGRPYFDKSSKVWYELWCERVFQKFAQLKIMNAEIAEHNSFYLDDEGYLGNTKTFSTVLKNEFKEDYYYFLALLNSSLLGFYHKQISVPKAGGYFEYKTQFLNLYPIRLIDDKDLDDVAKKKELSLLANQMLTSKKQLQQAKTESDKNYLERKCEQLDKEIDQLVYQLYGLTEEEIKIVEDIWFCK